MAKKFQNLRNEMLLERRDSVAAMTKDMLAEMPMHELRRARKLSQETARRYVRNQARTRLRARSRESFCK